jgi:hypothetical protein
LETYPTKELSHPNARRSQTVSKKNRTDEGDRTIINYPKLKVGRVAHILLASSWKTIIFSFEIILSSMSDTTLSPQSDTETTVIITTPEGEEVPYQPATMEQLHQDWPLDPVALAPIVAGLTALTRRGATKTVQSEDKDKNDKPKACAVKPRETFRAMRALNKIGWLALGQQRRDHKAKQHNGQQTLNDAVTAVIPEAHARMTEEAQRRGLSCAAELDNPTAKAIYAQAEKDHIARNGPLPQTGPTPIPPTAPERRNDWIIPQETQAEIMNRLRDMVDPHGDEYQELRPREYLMAVEVLLMYRRLVDAQVEFDRLVHTGGTATDWEAWDRLLEQKVPADLAAWKKEDEEEPDPEEAEYS